MPKSINIDLRPQFLSFKSLLQRSGKLQPDLAMIRSTRRDHCAKCQQFPTEWPCPKSTSFNHHETFKDLDQSAASGCAMCRLVWQLLVFQAELGKLMASSYPIMVQISGRTYISIGLQSDHVLVGSTPDGVSVYGLLEVKEGLGGNDESLLFESKICRECYICECSGV